MPSKNSVSKPQDWLGLKPYYKALFKPPCGRSRFVGKGCPEAEHTQELRPRQAGTSVKTANMPKVLKESARGVPQSLG